MSQAAPKWSPLQCGRRWIYFRYVKNKWYELDRVIRRAEVVDDGLLRIELMNGLVYFDRKTPMSPDRLAGDWAFKCGAKRSMASVRFLPEYEKLYTRLYQEFVADVHLDVFALSHGDTVIDAGANIGGFTLNAARLVGERGRVLAVEPGETNLGMLRRSVAASSLANVTVVPKGLWDHHDRKVFHLDDSPGLNSLYAERPGIESGAGSAGARTEEIEVDTLDNICAGLGVDRLELVKMDIEGAEIRALQGADEVLRNMKPKLVVEAGHKVDGRPTHETIVPFLEERGYTTRLHPKDGTIYAWPPEA